eukprot:m51a1_g8489 putative serine threonine kinase (1235) ;mRNA; f:551113-558982
MRATSLLLVAAAQAALATSYNWTPCTLFLSSNATHVPSGTLALIMAACMALMNASAAGLFGTNKVSILRFDDNSLTNMGPVAAATFSGFPVTAVIGGDSSRVSMSLLDGNATSPGLTVSGIPVISSKSTSPLLSDKKQYPRFMRVCPSDALTSLAMIQMFSKYGITRIAGIGNDDSYGQGGLQKLVTYAARATPPIEVVATIYYSATLSNPSGFNSTLTQLKATNAEAYVLYCASKTCLPCLEQARIMGMLENPYAWVMGNGIITYPTRDTVSTLFPELAKAITEKTSVLGMATAVDSNPVKDKFETDFAKFVGSTQAKSSYTYFEYDAALAWIYGVKKMLSAGKDPYNRSVLYSTLIALEYEGTTGDISFDDSGDRFAAMKIYRWVQGSDNLMVIGNWTIGAGVVLEPVYAPWAQWRGTMVAAKVILTGKLKELDEEKLLQEVAIMKSIRHPNLLLFMCFVRSDVGLTIVTEYMPNGSLYDVLSDKAVPMPLKLRLNVLNDIASGMAYLHGSNPPIIHCDLKSSNILLSECMEAKVCDFGLTVIAQQHGEIIKNGAFSTKSDVYAFGVMMWEMVTRDLPYKDMNPVLVAARVAENLRPEVGPEFDKVQPLRELMEQCWDQSPAIRPEFTDILMSLMKARELLKGLFMAIVFTDIQQSTELWEWNPSLMKEALYQHHSVMRAALRSNNGYEVKTEGDAFMIAFQAAIDALRFCVAAQRSLAEVDRSTTTTREALNSLNSYESSTGTNIDFIGPCVNKASRVASTAKGGQIVLSSATVQEIEHDKETLSQLGHIRDIGTVQLKGIALPETLYDFAISGLERQFTDGIEVLSMNSDLLKPHVPDAALDLYERFSQTKSVPTWVIAPGDIETIEEVKDKGSFGVVFRGVWRSQTVAVKKFFRQKVDSVTMTEIEHQIREIALLSEIRHPNVLLFMGACMEPHNMFIVTEWMDMGNLRQVISSGPQLDKQRGIGVLTSTCSALTYLHLCNIVHRDLKSSNILLNKRMDVKLSDFGLAAVKTANKTSTLCGTIAWMAPEVLSSAAYSEASDVYSFGVVMFEILSCELPFKGLNKVVIAREILEGKRPDIPRKLGAYTSDYVELMCSDNSDTEAGGEQEGSGLDADCDAEAEGEQEGRGLGALYHISNGNIHVLWCHRRGWVALVVRRCRWLPREAALKHKHVEAAVADVVQRAQSSALLLASRLRVAATEDDDKNEHRLRKEWHSSYRVAKSNGTTEVS